MFLKVYLNKTGKYKTKTYILTQKKFKNYYREMGFRVLCADSLLYRVSYKILAALHQPELFYHLVDKDCWFIMLGGSLFAENKGENAESLQLKNLAFAVKRAQETFVIGSNFGPYKNNSFLEGYTNLFMNTNDVCFRDKKSLDLFRGSLKNVRFSPDVVFEGEWHQTFSTLKNKVVISAIDLSCRENLSKYNDIYAKTLSDICIKHIKNGDQVILLSLCESEGDTIACNNIQEIVKAKIKTTIDIIRYTETNEILGLIENAKKIYATRFHALMISLYFQKKVVSIAYNEKTINATTSYCSDCPSFPIWMFNEQSAEKMYRCDRIPTVLMPHSNQFQKLEEALTNLTG